MFGRGLRKEHVFFFHNISSKTENMAYFHFFHYMSDALNANHQWQCFCSGKYYEHFLKYQHHHPYGF